MAKKRKIEEIITFLRASGKLKHIKRFTASIKSSKETTAEHSWRLALMVFLIAEELKLKINVEKAMKIALLHDLAESLTGDIDAYKVRSGQVLKEDKDKEEVIAIKKITKGLSFAPEINDLWYEYLNQTSKEARYVKALDKMEGFLHLLEKGHESYKKNIFYADYADESVKNFPPMAPFLKSVKKKLKKELSKSNIEWKE